MRALARAELVLDRMVWGLRRRFGRLGPLQIVAYRSFGTAQHASVRGRVLEASVLERSLPADTRLVSFRRMLRRLNSHELPEAAVRVELGSRAVDGRTDDEGYFELPVAAPELGDVGAWKTAEVTVLAAPLRGFAKVRATAEILVPGASAEHGIISDIDDTVLQTYVTQ
ncbi:MAG TPA: hypothetical protein VNG33_19010, partial [Polyangiaceae bacterium]|nr:hypothetical protein [Polyangiaceae bacterium]